MIDSLLLGCVRLVPIASMFARQSDRVLPRATRVAICVMLVLGAAPWLATHPTSFTVRPEHVMHELLLGLSLALVLAVPLFVLDHATAFVDELSRNENTDTQRPLRSLSHALGVAVFAASGGLRAVVRAISQSFVAHPLGEVLHPIRLTWREAVITWTGRSLSQALDLAIPLVLSVLATELAWNSAMRTAPWLRTSGVTVFLHRLVPLILLVLVLGLWTTSLQALARHSLEAVQTLYG